MLNDRLKFELMLAGFVLTACVGGALMLFVAVSGQGNSAGGAAPIAAAPVQPPAASESIRPGDLCLWNCPEDPRVWQEANTASEMTDQAVLDAEQQRVIREAEQAAALEKQKALNDLDIANRRYTDAVDAQKYAAAARAWTLFIQVTVFFGALALAALMISGTAGASITIIQTAKLLPEMTQSRMRITKIAMDPETMQFPAVLIYQGKGRFSLTDANTRTTQLLDSRDRGDRQMIAAANAVRLTGIVATQARKAANSSSEGVAMVGTHPAIVDGSTE